MRITWLVAASVLLACDSSVDATRWTTFCEGTSCHCLESGEPLCACETEVPWCEVPSSSCCPPPWP